MVNEVSEGARRAIEEEIAALQSRRAQALKDAQEIAEAFERKELNPQGIPKFSVRDVQQAGRQVSIIDENIRFARARLAGRDPRGGGAQRNIQAQRAEFRQAVGRGEVEGVSVQAPTSTTPGSVIRGDLRPQVGGVIEGAARKPLRGEERLPEELRQPSTLTRAFEAPVKVQRIEERATLIKQPSLEQPRTPLPVTQETIPLSVVFSTERKPASIAERRRLPTTIGLLAALKQAQEKKEQITQRKESQRKDTAFITGLITSFAVEPIKGTAQLTSRALTATEIQKRLLTNIGREIAKSKIAQRIKTQEPEIIKKTRAGFEKITADIVPVKGSPLTEAEKSTIVTIAAIPTGFVFGAALRATAKGVTAIPALTKIVGSRPGKAIRITGETALTVGALSVVSKEVSEQETAAQKGQALGRGLREIGGGVAGTIAERKVLGSVFFRRKFGEPLSELRFEERLQAATREGKITPILAEELRQSAVLAERIRGKRFPEIERGLSELSPATITSQKELQRVRKLLSETESIVFGTAAVGVKRPKDIDVQALTESALFKLKKELRGQDIKAPGTLEQFPGIQPLRKIEGKAKAISVGEQLRRKTEGAFIALSEGEIRRQKDIESRRILEEAIRKSTGFKGKVDVASKQIFRKRKTEITKSDQFKVDKDSELSIIDKKRKISSSIIKARELSKLRIIPPSSVFSRPLPSKVSAPSLIPSSIVPGPSLVPPSIVPGPSLVPPSIVPGPSLVPPPIVPGPSLVPPPLLGADFPGGGFGKLFTRQKQKLSTTQILRPTLRAVGLQIRGRINIRAQRTGIAERPLPLLTTKQKNGRRKKLF